MKNKAVKLSIDSPCSENWVNMIATTKGAFCQQCQKEVIDFSKLSDNQIIEFFYRYNGSVCGKLKNSQVDRIINPTQTYKFSQPGYYKLFVGIFISTFWNHSVLAKSNVFDSQKQNTFFTEKQLIDSDAYEPKKDSSKHIIKGKILDKENNEPIPFANVFIADFGIGVSTDLDGRFSLSIPDSLSKYNLTLKINFLGYESLEFSNINLQMLSKEDVYFLKPGEQVIMGELVNSIYIPEIPKKKKWWQRKSK